MTGREEFVREYPHLAAELDRIGQRAIITAAHEDVRAGGRVDTDVIAGGLPFVAGFGVVVAGMACWSWTLWLIPLAILLGILALAAIGEALAWASEFTAGLAIRAAWLRGTGTGTGSGRRGGDRP